MMTPKTVFVLAVRILGLVFLFRGLLALPEILSIFSTGSFRSSLSIIIMIAWPLALAFWLIRGAPLLVSIAYSDSAELSRTDFRIQPLRQLRRLLVEAAHHRAPWIIGTLGSSKTDEYPILVAGHLCWIAYLRRIRVARWLSILVSNLSS